MPDRTLRTVLDVEIAGYKAKLAQAAAATAQFATNASGYVDKNRKSIDKLSTKAGLIGVSLAAGVGASIGAAAKFDQAMSGVASTGDDARKNMEKLRAAALKAGADTKFSATQAAGGIEALAKAGVNADDVLKGGLNGALALAAAGNIDVADAADTAATAMNEFKLKGKDVPHIADLLAQAAGSAQGEVSDMSLALKQGGLVASQFGLSIDDTTTTLALFAKNGLIGSDAGTAFKTMLLSLANPSKQSADAMKRLGIAAYDSQGSFVGIGNLADQLHDKLGGLSQAQRQAALSTIFGTDAIRAASVLYDQGSAGLSKMSASMRSFGSAADVAATKMDNLAGDVEQFRGSAETALIGLGEGGQGPLRSLTKSATGAVNEFNSLGSGAKQTFLLIGGGTATLALVAAGLGKAAVAASETRAAMTALGISMKGVAAGGAAVVGTFAAIEAGSKILGHFQSDVHTVDALTNALKNVAAGSTDLSQLYSRNSWADGLMNALTGSTAEADDLGSALRTLNTAANGNGFQRFMLGFVAPLREQLEPGTQSLEKMRQQVGNVDKALADLAANGNAKQASAAFNAIAKQTGVPVETLIKLMPQYTAALNTNADAAAKSARATRPTVYSQAAAALQALQNTSGQAAGQVERLTASMLAAANAALQLSGDEIGFEAAVDGATASIKQNGKTLDIHTEKGRANRQALDGIASAGLKLIQTQIDQGKSAGTLARTTQKAREEFIRVGRQMGLTKGQAAALATQYGLVPKNVKTKAEMDARQAKAEAAKVKNAIKDIPPSKQAQILSIWKKDGYQAAIDALNAINGKTATTYINTVHTTTNISRSGLGKQKPQIATGGLVTGPGTGTSDSIDAKLSNGEVVIKAASVRSIGVDRLLYANAHGELPHFAEGGLVGSVGFATGGTVDVAAIYRLIRAITDPLAQVSAAASKVAAAHHVYNAAERKIARPTAVLTRADRAYDAAVSRRDDIKDRVNRLAREAAATKGTTAADRALKRARIDLAEANAKVTRTSHAKTAAQKAYDKVSGPAKKAAEQLKAAQQALAEQQQAVADSAKALSAQFSDTYRSQSTDARDWIDLMRQGTGDIGAFTAQVAKLRKAGLSEGLIQQILGMGANTGGELAGNILSGGSSLIAQLNKANAALQAAADNLGYLGTTGRARKKALGGPITGPGTGTSDDVPIMASNGEWIVPAAAVPANRPALEAMTYGRSVVSHTHAQGHYAYGGPVSSRGGAVDSRLIAAAVQAGLEGMTIRAELDGAPFDARIVSAQRATGRALARTH